MKNNPISMFFLLFIGCSSVEEQQLQESVDASADVEERQTYPTPSRTENVRNGGCVSVVYINGQKEVFPCAGKPLPHGPIYETNGRF